MKSNKIHDPIGSTVEYVMQLLFAITLFVLICLAPYIFALFWSAILTPIE